MILKLQDRGMGDIEVTVDPVVLHGGDVVTVVDPSTGQTATTSPGAAIDGTLPKPFDWTWILVAAAAGLLIGWWLSQEDRRGGGPT